MDSDKEMLTIETEDGEVFEREILFTYEDEESKQKYVFIIEPEEGEEESILVLRYFDDGRLEEVESDEELDKLQEVLDAFLSEEDDESFDVVEE
ncbi:MAG: DUF1292 domain-containing protein [Bacilli bacterium]|jgi:uncharacterized protein YrzB (UPF0473 family)|nr:DUF1292 domain-containing protein [Bacilli bacterium]NLN79796.1 DUF1292 domain-containing protein [Erysipelotrichia bacterium]